jgi:hypothetical protein
MEGQEGGEVQVVADQKSQFRWILPQGLNYEYNI